MKRFAWMFVIAVGCGGSATEGEAEAEAEAEAESESESEAEAEGGCPACEAADPTCQCAFSDDIVQANLGDDGDAEPPLEPADYSCLGNNPAPPAPKGDATVRGAGCPEKGSGDCVYDFESDGALEGATVEAFPSSESFDANCAETTSGDLGAYEITLGADCFSDGDARVSWRVTAKDQLLTLHLNQLVECETVDPCAMEEGRVSVSETTAAVIPAIIGTMAPAGTSIVVGDVIDCQRRSVANAAARLYDEGGALVGGIEVYYFQVEFPVRRSSQQFTSPDGLVAMMKVLPGGLVDIQAWGRTGPDNGDQFTEDGAETLLSSVRVPPFADSVVITDMDPLAE